MFGDAAMVCHCVWISTSSDLLFNLWWVHRRMLYVVQSAAGRRCGDDGDYTRSTKPSRPQSLPRCLSAVNIQPQHSQSAHLCVCDVFSVILTISHIRFCMRDAPCHNIHTIIINNQWQYSSDMTSVTQLQKSRVWYSTDRAQEVHLQLPKQNIYTFLRVYDVILRRHHY